MSSKQRKKSPPVERQKLQASIDIFDQSIVATRYAHDGQLMARSLVTPEDIVKMIGDMRDQAIQWYKPSPGVVVFGTDANGQQRCLLIRPAKRTTIKIEVGNKTQRLTIRMPNLLAELVGDGETGSPLWKKVAAVYCFAGSGGAKNLTNKTRLYVPPLPNIYATGNICMGSVSVKHWAKLPPAEAFEKAFIETPFTDHILSAPLKKSGRGAKYRNILDALKRTGGNVPLTELVKLRTFGELLKGKVKK